MSCNNCSSEDTILPNGCNNNGNCANCGCEKLTVFNWLANITPPSNQPPITIYEVAFKNGRKGYFNNVNNLPLYIGDIVSVEGNPGHDVGTITLSGELIKTRLRKKNIADDSDEIKKIFRKATQKDIDVWQKSRAKELETQSRGREIISRLGLKMKLSDVEYQGDGSKANFYYTADDRVDFRQLIRDLAGAFGVRVEMKQVGLRQEAARLGGVGSCGRELCCSTWLTDFRKVNTTSARYQQLSLNPQKLAGQCGKLKCCLNFELETYMDALKSFPDQNTVLKTEKDDAIFVKMDIFKELLWYVYKSEKTKWYKLSLEQVIEILELNKNNQKSAPLEFYESEIVEQAPVDFENVVGQDSLTRFDKPKRKRKSRKRRDNKTQKVVHMKKQDQKKNQSKRNQKN